MMQGESYVYVDGARKMKNKMKEIIKIGCTSHDARRVILYTGRMEMIMR